MDKKTAPATQEKVSLREKISLISNRKLMVRGKKYHLGETLASYTLLLPTIITLLILRMGSFLDSGFDQIYLMLNSYNRDVATVFDTYVYDVGLTGTITAPAGTTNYSYSATVGVFRSVISLILVITSNALAKLAGEEGVY